MSWKNHSNNKFNRILVVNWVQYKLNRIIEATKEEYKNKLEKSTPYNVKMQ